MEETAPHRYKLYQNLDARSLLSLLIKGEITVIAPSPDTVYKYRYPTVEKKLGLPPDKVEALLVSLMGAGLLERELASVVLACPSCKSFRFIVAPLCPHCRSKDLSRNTLYEHIPCGQIGLEQYFTTEEKLMCPRCKREFGELNVDYRIAGITYKCISCGRSFDAPLFHCDCQDCGTLFSLLSANFLRLYQYTFNESFREEVVKNVVSLDPVLRVLKDLGFTPQMPGFLAGASGVQHKFDIVALYPQSESDHLIIDLVSGMEALPESVLSLFARVMDVKPKRTILIAVPKLREDAKSIAIAYKIDFIEETDIEKAAERLKETLSSAA